MATLEKIRKRSWILLVIIGVALLAFIFTDFEKLAHTFFGNDTHLAKFDGERVEYPEFQKRSEAAMRNNEGTTDEEHAYMDQEILKSLIVEKLREKAYNKLGLTVTDKELNDAVNGSGKIFADLLASQLTQGQVQTAAQLFQITSNTQGMEPAQAQQMSQMWMMFEEQLTQQLLDNKFMSMLDGTMTANKLDAQQLYTDQNTGYMITAASKPYNTYGNGDKNFEPTEAELKAEYENQKYLFKLTEPTRLVNFVSVPIVPSTDDEVACRNLIKQVVADLNSKEELAGLKGQKGFESTITTSTLSAIKALGNQQLTEFADSGAVGTAKVVSDGPLKFEIAKILGRNVEVDSLTISIAVVSAEANADSIRGLMAAGAKAEALNGVEGVAFAMDSIATSLTAPVQNMPISEIVAADFRSYKDQFLNTALGTPFMPDSLKMNPQFTTIYTVTKRNAPERNVEYAMVTYNLRPSTATVDGIRADLEKYMAENNTAAKFVENESQLNTLKAQTLNQEITASTPYVMIGRDMFGNVHFMDNSNKAAIWAMNAKQGEVSPIFGDERIGSFVVAAVVDVYDQYLTLSDPNVKTYISNLVTNNKKAEAMIKEYGGKAKDVAGYATVMGVETANDAVNFFNGGNYGAELLATIVTTPKGKMVGPSKGEQAVVVFQVTDINNPTRAFNYKSDSQAFNQIFGAGRYSNVEGMYRLLLGNKKVDNNLINVIKRD